MILEKGYRDRKPDVAIRWGKQKCVCVTGLPEMCWGGGFSLCAYRAQLGRLGGSRLELGSLNKIPCHEHTFSLTHWRTDGHTGERTVERVLKSVFTVLLF